MKENMLHIPYSEDLLLSLKESKEQFEQNARFFLAVKLYELGKISSGKAAKLHEELADREYVPAAPGSRNLRDVETGVQIEFVVTGDFPGDGKQKPVAFPDPGAGVETREDIKVIDLKSLIELKLASGMTAKARLQDLADVQRLIQHHHLTADFAKQLHPYVRKKFLELLS